MSAPTAVETLTTVELAEQAGVSYMQVHRWGDYGIIRPVSPTRGQGYPLEWSASLVPLVRMLGRYTAAVQTHAAPSRTGIQRERLAHLADHLREAPDWLDRPLVHIDPRGVPHLIPLPGTVAVQP